MTITFIGYGAMARAMIKPLSQKYKIEVIGRDINKLEKLKRDFPNTTIETFENFDSTAKNIILCIKPYALVHVSKYFSNETSSLISILAGTPLQTLKEHIKSKSYIRAMPNIASSQSKSMTTLTGDVSFHDNAIEILNAIGSTLWLNSEKELDIATALAGCAPAYLAMVAEALCDGAVKEGLTRTDAQKLTTGLFDGFASLLHVQHPALLKESVMSPAGMTAVGVAILEKYAMRFAFMEAIAQSYEKSQKVQK